MRGKFNKSDTFVYLLTKGRMLPAMQKLSNKEAFVKIAKEIAIWSTIKLKRTNRQPLEIREDWMKYFKSIKSQALSYEYITQAEIIARKWRRENG